MQYIFFDTETTGLLGIGNPKPRIIELSFVRTDEDFTVLEDYSTLVFCEDVPEHITKINGITQEMLLNKPNFSSCIPKINEFINKNGEETVFVAHNLPFDLGMIESEYELNGKEFVLPSQKTICTAELSEQIYGYRVKLSDLYALLCNKPIGKYKQSHRAYDDVLMVIDCLKSFIYT